MHNHLTKTQIEDYGRRRLSVEELLSVSEHLDACQACRRRVRSLLDGNELYHTLKYQVLDEAEGPSSGAGQVHLTAEQTAEYIDGTLTGEDLRSVSDHLTFCERCETAVNDLLAFKDQVSTELNREYKLSWMNRPAEAGGHRLTALLSSLRTKLPWFVPSSVLAVLLLTIASWLLWQSLHKGRPNPLLKPDPSQNVSTPTLLSSTEERAAATIVARINDGERQVTLDEAGKLSGVDHLPPDYQQMVKAALIDQRLEKSSLLAGLTRVWRTPRSSNNDRKGEFSVIDPVGKMILSDHPTLSWSRLDGAVAYVVEVYDEEFVLASSSPQIIDHSWTIPQPLKRGRIYFWQVKAIIDDQTSIPARSPSTQTAFRILDRAKADELARARRAYTTSHLTLGLLYVRAGLIDEAEREFRVLQKTNPDSPIPRQLLTQVRSMRRS